MRNLFILLLIIVCFQNNRCFGQASTIDSSKALKGLVKTQAQPKNEFGVTAGVFIPKVSNSENEQGCLGCAQEYVSFNEKSTSVGEDIGVYYKRRLGKRFALNLEVDANYFNSSFFYYGTYSSRNYSGIIVTQDYDYGSQNLTGNNVQFFYLTTNVELLFYLNKEDVNKNRLYFKVGISPRFILESSGLGNLNTYDTVETRTSHPAIISTSMKSQTPTLGEGGYEFGIGFQTPEYRKHKLRFEFLYRGNMSLTTDFLLEDIEENLSWNSFVFKVGVSF